MLQNTFYSRFHDVDTIHSVYGLTPPSKKQMSDNSKKLQKVIIGMGDKYCLAKPVERIVK